MANKIVSGSSTDQLDINTDKEAKVALSKVISKAGFAALVGMNDQGSITGTPQARSPRVTVDQRLTIGMDTLLDSDTFTSAIQNTAKHQIAVTTQGIIFTSGFVQTNNALITTTATGSLFSTRGTFPLPYEGGLAIEAFVQLSAIGAANVEHYLGWFINGGATTAPTDGVYLKITSAGIFGASVFASGTENLTGAFAGIVLNANTTYKFKFYINNRQADFYINDVLYGTLNAPAGASQLNISPALPFVMHTRNTGVASVGTSFKLGAYCIWSSDTNSGKDYATIKSLQGLGGYQIQNNTSGSTAQYANSANPAAAVPSNSAAALATGLGGQFWETDTLAANTDGIIMSYQNPATTIAVPGKNLLVYGVWLESFVQTVLTGGGYNAQWSIAAGSNAVSLANGESSTSRSPRRIPLGLQSVAAGAAALSLLQNAPLYRAFKVPLVIYPGEFLQVVKKKIGTVPSAGVIVHIITVDAVWE